MISFLFEYEQDRCWRGKTVYSHLHIETRSYSPLPPSWGDDEVLLKYKNALNFASGSLIRVQLFWVVGPIMQMRWHAADLRARIHLDPKNSAFGIYRRDYIFVFARTNRLLFITVLCANQLIISQVTSRRIIFKSNIREYNEFMDIYDI